MMINWMGGWPREGLISSSEWEERLAAAAERFLIAGTSDLSSRLPKQDQLQEIMAEGLLNGITRRFGGGLRLARGADAALGRLAQHSLSAGDVVLVESLTSRSALQVFRKAGARIEAVFGDRQGMDPDALKRAISRHKPRLVYAAPACSDPDGKAWSRQRTEEAVEMCRASHVLMLRDDRQEMLIYDDELYGRLYVARSGDRQKSLQGEKGVLSIGQLPPGLVAGLRFGWVAGHADELEQWLPDSQAADTPTASELLPLECLALVDLLLEQPLADQIDMLRVRNRARMLRITELLGAQSSSGLNWRPPDGGGHLWLTLPEGLDGEALLRAAWLRGLIFQPGAPFYATESQPHTLRLTFADSDERQLKLGTQRLFETIGDFMGRSR